MTEPTATNPTTTEPDNEAEQLAKSFIPNRLYDALKWSAMIILPATSVLTLSVSTSLGYAAQGQIAATIITAIGAFVGTVVGASAASYKS